MGTKTLLSDTSKNADIKRQILRLCIIRDNYSIADLSRELNTSVPTVTKIIGELIEEGFLRDLGKVGTSGGRRPSIFGLDAAAGYFIGVDIARQHIHLCITDFKGDVVSFVPDIEFILEARADSFKALCRLVKETVAATGISWDKVLSVGVSLSGRVNPEEGYSMSYFMSDDLPLNAIFEKDFNVPVSIENDSRAMTYGEFLAGNHPEEASNILAVNLSWGLGMGMILDGKLYYGKSGFSGEIGHVPLLDNEKICRCGKVGCLETGASGSALHDMILECLRSGRPSSLSKKYTPGKDLSLDDILEAVEEEDVLAIDCIGKIGETLGRGIAGLINIFNPGLVIIGGRLIVGKKYLMYPIKTAVNKYSLNRVNSDTKIVYSTLGRRAASIGNCLIARSKYLGLI